MGACSSHKRLARPARVHPLEMTSPPQKIKGLRISMPTYIESNDTRKPKTKPELTSINKITDEHFSPYPVKQPSASHLLSPHDIQKGESSSTERKRESSVTRTTFDDNSTSPPEDSQEECSPPGRQQLQRVGYDVTNLPSELWEQLTNLANSDDPGAKAAAEQLLNWITNLPAPDDSKQSQEVADIVSSRSSDMLMRVKDNHVNITNKQEGDTDDPKWTNLELVTVESEPIVAQSDPLKPSRLDSGKSEPILSTIFSGETLETPKDDEKGNIDIVEFSKRQLDRSRRKSLMMSKVLGKMPTLSQSLANSKRSSSFSGKLPSLTRNGSAMLPEADTGFENMTSKIDDLDKKISESTQKITELRRKSFGLLTDGHNSDDSDDEGKNRSFLIVEKEINQWQTQKNKLVDERDKIVTEMQSKIIDQITATDLIASPDALDKADDFCTSEKDMVTEQPQLPDRTLSKSVTETSSPMSNLYIEEYTQSEESE